VRSSIAILVMVVVASWSAVAFAKPKVAVAPLDGDADGKIGAVVSDAASAHGTVTSAKVVAKALKDLSISDPDTAKAAKKLRKHLGVDAVIYGKVEPVGGKKQLRISVYTHGKKPEHFELEFKKSSSKAFHNKLRDELTTLLAPDESVKEDDSEPAASDEEANARARKHARHLKVLEAERPPLTQPVVIADAGIGGVHRSLNYVANAGGSTPPPVGTGAFAVQLDGEVYPAAFDSLEGNAASLGIFGSLNKAVGLSISIPGATQSASISETTFALGGRYRFVFGQSSVAAGLAFWGQTFTADRSSLTTPTQLNMPDTTYYAIAPDVLLRLALTPTVGLALQLDLPLVLASGPITEPTYFGVGTVFAFAFQGAVDIALDRHYGLHLATFLDQESLSFKAGMVGSATDRTIGLSIAFGVMY